MPPRRHAAHVTPTAVFIVASAAWASPIDRAIDHLDAPTLKERESAVQTLVERRDLSLSAVEAAMLREGLSPEQARRLRQVGEDLFRAAPRAALGVSFATVDSPVRIGRTVENFPAEELLRPGDLVLAVGETPLQDSDHLRHVILSHNPEDTLRLTIERDGELVRIEVPLGRYIDLRQGTQIDPSSLAAAYQIRLERLGIEEGAPMIGADLEHGAWERLAAGRQRGPLAFNDLRDRPTIGGEPRVTVGRAWFTTTTEFAGRPQPAGERLQLLISRRNELNRSRIETMIRVEQLEEKLGAQDNIDEQQRSALRAELEQALRQLERLEDEILRLQEDFPRP